MNESEDTKPGGAEPPAIEFPCENYPIKVIAESGEQLVSGVVEIVRRHDETFRAQSVSLNPSREGKYTSVRLSIRATGEIQLRELHEELMAHPAVQLVL